MMSREDEGDDNRPGEHHKITATLVDLAKVTYRTAELWLAHLDDRLMTSLTTIAPISWLP